jgi:hypothetical protein
MNITEMNHAMRLESARMPVAHSTDKSAYVETPDANQMLVRIWATLLVVAGLMYAVSFQFMLMGVERETLVAHDSLHVARRVDASKLGSYDEMPLTNQAWNIAEAAPLENTPFLNGKVVTMDPPSLKFLANVMQANSMYFGSVFICVVMLICAADSETFPKSRALALFILSAHKVICFGVLVLLVAGSIYLYVGVQFYVDMFYPHYTLLLAGASFTLDPPVMIDDQLQLNNNLGDNDGYHQTIAGYSLYNVWLWTITAFVMLMVSGCINRCTPAAEDYAVPVAH